jgi:hypothetical protein
MLFTVFESTVIWPEL